MKILIIAATSAEIAPVMKHLQATTENMQFYTTAHTSVDILITNIGMTSTAFWLGKYLSKKYDLAINAGIAGSLNPDIAIGQVVHVKADCLIEMGKIQNGTFHSFINHKLFNPKDILFTENKSMISKTIHDLHTVNGITVNTSNDSLRKSIPDSSYTPGTESMEGAAVMYACRQEQIPCYQIRSISNLVSEQDTQKWNIPLAISNLNDALIKILQELI